jgi:hypothetical protein
MKLVVRWTLAAFLMVVPCAAQASGEWERVYTFEDSFVELNTRRVFHDGDGVFRVTFRWSFGEPQVFSADPRVRHRGRLEVFQVDCRSGLYRVREVTPLDAAGRPVAPGVRNTDEELRRAGGRVTGQLLNEACRLVKRRVRQEAAAEAATPPAVSETEPAEKFARAFARRLEQTRDFAPLVREFFAPDYLGGYLRDPAADWLVPLGRETAARASRAELRRFHTAALNAAYLGGAYLNGRNLASPVEPADEGALLPPDVLRLIESHPYTARFGRGGTGYEHLSETIDGVERLRVYTDLLERVGELFRKHADAGGRRRRVVWEETWRADAPRVRVCERACLGLPAGTKLYEVGVPVFRLQLAEIDGALKVVSVSPY